MLISTKQGERIDRLYDRNFAVAFICQTLFVSANSSMAHYARFIAEMGGDERHVGWITGAGAVFGLALRPWIGTWIDRVGDRSAMAVGYVLYILSIVGNLFQEDLSWPIYVLRGGMLVGGAIFFASSLTYITRTSPPTRRTEAIGSLGAGGFLGMFIGPYIGDLCLANRAAGFEAFDWLFGVAAAEAATAFLLLLCLKPAPAPKTKSPISAAAFWKTVRAHWPGAILLIDVTFGVCMTVPFIFLSKFVDSIGLKEIGSFFLVYAGWGLFLRLALHRLTDRLPGRWFVVLGMLGFAAGMFSFLWIDASSPGMLLFSAFLCGTAHAITFPAMIALTMETFPAGLHGVGSVLALMHLDVGQIAGAPILGVLAYYAGYSVLFVVLGVVCLLTAAVFAWFTCARRLDDATPTSLSADSAVS